MELSRGLACFSGMPSSVIRAYRYHPETKRLEIDFVSGRRYAYLNVPAQVAEALRMAGSKGEYFNARVRDRFRYEREA
jgi:lysyl-tRNA synthetase class 2